MTDAKNEADSGASASNAGLAKLKAWVSSPEGQAELAAALIAADIAVKQLEKERAVTWQQMHEPMTI